MMRHHIFRVAMCLICIPLLAGCRADPLAQQPPATPPASFSNNDWAAVLNKVVTPDGYVRWNLFQTNDDGVRDKLIQYVGLIAAISPANRPDLFPSADARRAYWINTYNALCMYWVIHNDYPGTVPEQMQYEFTVGGSVLSLNDILVWFKRHDADPTVYFALNCCAHSCPPLRSTPYDPAVLDAQLTDQGHVYLSDPRAVVRNGDTVEINHLLYGHISDFAKTVGRDSTRYWQAMQSYAQDDSPLIGADRGVDSGFDWSLNEPPR